MKQCFPLFLLGLLLLQCTSRSAGIIPVTGMQVTRSTHIRSGTHFLPPDSATQSAAIIIEGEDLIIDFQHALIIGDTFPDRPNTYKGVAIHVKSGRNITLKNVQVKGYKIGILAEDIEQLTIQNADLSFNYREELGSTPEREDLSDWMSFQQNEDDEWKRYGAGIYLKNCIDAQVTDCRVSNGQNGLMLAGCNNGLFANNTFHFNSGVGIGLYRSGKNRIMHNRLDWNVRGFSLRKYARGQESSGIMIYTASSNNTIAYNSATHCGNGICIWPGEETIKTGEGGSNDNLIFANDFSYSSMYGIRMVMGRNKIINNRMEGCIYGIRGAYSYNSVFAGNYFHENRCGLAIEHGQGNFIDRNIFEHDQVGLWTWERRRLPDWGFIDARDPKSSDYLVVNNVFTHVDTPLKILQTNQISASGNTFAGFQTLLHNNRAVDLVENDIYTLRPPYRYLPQNEWVKDTSYTAPPQASLQMTQYAPAPIESGLNTLLSPEHPHGRASIIMTEWGPYNFQYPICRLRDSLDDGLMVFEVLGPEGIWKLNQSTGLKNVSVESGTIPSTFTAAYEDDTEHDIQLRFSFIGKQVRDEFGQLFSEDQPYTFRYSRFSQPLNWAMAIYAYDDRNHPIEKPTEFATLLTRTPRIRQRSSHLNYYWEDRPSNRVPSDRFATVSETQSEFKAGTYEVRLGFDEGIRFYLDDNLVFEDWKTRSQPTRARIPLKLAGEHTFRIEHFDESGIATLLFDISPEQKAMP